MAKCAATLAHIACLDWPHAYPDYWGQLQALLGSEQHVEAGLVLLTATVEGFHLLATTTAMGMRGKVRRVCLGRCVCVCV